MELPNSETPDTKTEDYRAFDVIVLPAGGGDEQRYNVGWALQG